MEQIPNWIYFSYDEHVWWYEIFELFRKLFLNGIVVFVGPGSLAQIILSCFMCLGALYIALNIKPYQDDSDDLLANICLAQLFLSLFLGLFVRLHTETNRDAPEWVSILIIVTNVVVVLVGIFLVFSEKMLSSVGLNRAYKKRVQELNRKQFAKRSWIRMGGSATKKIHRKQTLIGFQQLVGKNIVTSKVSKGNESDDYSWPDSDASEAELKDKDENTSDDAKATAQNRFASWGSAETQSQSDHFLSGSGKHQW